MDILKNVVMGIMVVVIPVVMTIGVNSNKNKCYDECKRIQTEAIQSCLKADKLHPSQCVQRAADNKNECMHRCYKDTGDKS